MRVIILACALMLLSCATDKAAEEILVNRPIAEAEAGVVSDPAGFLHSELQSHGYVRKNAADRDVAHLARDTGGSVPVRITLSCTHRSDRVDVRMRSYEVSVVVKVLMADGSTIVRQLLGNAIGLGKEHEDGCRRAASNAIRGIKDELMKSIDDALATPPSPQIDE